MGINKLCSPLPPTKDNHKERMRSNQENINIKDTTEDNFVLDNLAVQFDQDPSMLHEQLQHVKWPICYKAKVFSANATLKELCVTQNYEFTHEPMLIENHDLRYKNNHCTLCWYGRTNYCCNDCKS